MVDTSYTGQSTKGTTVDETKKREKQTKAEGTMADKAAVRSGMAKAAGGGQDTEKPPSFDLSTPEGRASLRKWREDRDAKRFATPTPTPTPSPSSKKASGRKASSSR